MHRGVSVHEVLERGQPGPNRQFKMHPVIDLIIPHFSADYGPCKELSFYEMNTTGRSTRKVTPKCKTNMAKARL